MVIPNKQQQQKMATNYRVIYNDQKINFNDLMLDGVQLVIFFLRYEI